MQNLYSTVQIPLHRSCLVLLMVTALIASTSFAQRTEREERREDPERITRYWRTALPPDDYMRALESTGQLSALQRIAKPTDTDWTHIGPTGDFDNVQRQIGRIRSIHIRPFTGDYYVYVGASSGGLWRTRGSSGPVWTSLGERLPNPAVGAFAVNPNNPSDILVGTGDFNRYPGAGMFRTPDAGQTWDPVPLPVSPGAFFRIDYLPGNSNIVLAASDQGLLRSTNGASGPWTVVRNGIVTDLVIHPSNPSVQFLCRATSGGAGGGIYKSTDSGQTWTFVNTGAPTNTFGVGKIAICRDAPNTLAFVYEWGGFIAGIRKSTNGGSIWTDITGSLQNTNGQAFHALAIAIRPNNPNEIYVGSVLLYRSTDGGATWPDVGEQVREHVDHTQLYFNATTGDDVLWLSNDAGVYRWTVGASSSNSWNGNQTTGLRVSQIYQLEGQRDFRAVAMQDVGIVGSITSGSSWKPFGTADGAEVELTDDLNNTFWFIDGIYCCGFPTWLAHRQPFNGAKQRVNSNESYLRLFYDRFSDRIYSVNADGSPFHLVSSPASGTLSWREEIVLPDWARRIAGSYLDGKTFFGYNNWSTDTLLVLQRTGAGWSSYRAVFGTNRTILSVFASTEQPGESWAGLTGSAGTPRLFHTRNYWRNWEDVTGTLPTVGAINAILVPPFNSKEIYLATDLGVFRTQDGGQTWEPFQTGLPIVRCTDLRYVVDRTRRGNDKLLVSTYGRGVYERTLTRPPLVYVDPRNTGFEDGTFTHPYNTFSEGLNATPERGILALNGNAYTAPMILNKPMTINAYESAAELRR